MANNKVETEYDLNIEGLISGLRTIAQAFRDHKNEIKELSEDPFREAAKGAVNYEKEISSSAKKLAELEAINTAFKQELKEVNAELAKQRKAFKDVASAQKYKEASTQVKQLRDELKKANDELKKMQNEGKKATSILSRIKGGFLGAITGNMTGGGAGTQTVAAILGLINPALGATAGILGSLSEKAFNATSNWQGYTVALKSSLGTQQLANQNLSVLEELATRLPVGLNEATNAYSQLVNRGFRPLREELSNLSGFAASQNKTFDQFIQAILDAEEGQLDRLHEFGVKAGVEGNKVTITFNGITKTFEKGARDSVKAFADLAKELGSDKLNAEKMQTLAGRMSNLGDQTDKIARKFGEVFLPVFEAVLTITDKVLTKIDSSITGWSSFDDTLKEVSKTTGENAYPTLKKLLDLFSTNEEGRDRWADFFFALNAGFERLINAAELFASVMANITNPSGIAAALGRFAINDNNITQAVQKFMNTQQGKTSAGEFVYGPNKPTTKPGPTEAEIKAAEARARKLADLERKLTDELLKIENEYGKEKLEALKDNELEYIEAKRKYDLAQIDQEQKALLRLKQLVSGARKGMFDKSGNVIADSSATLTAAESAPFDFRRELVDQQAYKERADFINAAEKRITELVSNEYQKQLQAVEYKYEQEIILARKAGIDVTKIEKQKAKEIAKINTDKALSDLEKQALQEQGDAELNIIRAQIEGRTGVELEARKGLLEIERKFIVQKIAIIEASGDEESEARVRALKKQLGEIDLAIKEVTDKDKERKGLSKWLADTLGMNDTDVDEALQAAQTFATRMQSIMSDLYSSLNRLSEQRIQRINDEISKKEDQVRVEQELNEQGTANNLSLRLKELEDLKEARERALQDQRRLQRTQLIVDTASQASSMITAASKVYAGFAGIPIVGVGLGIAAVALMLGAFAAAKIKAFQLVNQQPQQFEFGGRKRGRRHSEGGEIVEVEDGEWIINRNSSEEYNDLLNAINQNDKAGILDHLLKDLLDGTGVTMSDADRRREMRFMADARRVNEDYGNEMVLEMQKMRAEMAEIKANTARIPRYASTALGDGKVLEKDTLNGSKSITDYSDMLD